MAKGVTSNSDIPILKVKKSLHKTSTFSSSNKVVPPNPKMVVRTKLEKPKKIRKKRKLKYSRIFIAFFVCFIFVLIIRYFAFLPIKNIYIEGNTMFEDQEIIELSFLSNYPASFSNSSNTIQKRLEENVYIQKAIVWKKNLTEVHIQVVENRPLFYNSNTNRTILMDGEEVTESFAVPILINYVPDTIYSDFIRKMGEVDVDVLQRISEIKYDPNDVDSGRFLLTMNDENYVYLTLLKFKNINRYISIVRNFEHKRGILYLDAGEYFDVFE